MGGEGVPGFAKYKANRVDRRLAEHQTGTRRVVVIMREHGGRTLPFVFKSEDASVVMIARTVAPGMPTKQRIGTRYMRASSPSGSITAKAIRTAKPVPIKRSRFSPAFAVRKSAFTTTLPARTCQPNGVAGKQPPREQWRAIFDDDKRGPHSPGVSSMEGILAAVG
jgi:hypothetical protein